MIVKREMLKRIEAAALALCTLALCAFLCVWVTVVLAFSHTSDAQHDKHAPANRGNDDSTVQSVFEPEPEPVLPEYDYPGTHTVTLSFVGDCMLGSSKGTMKSGSFNDTAEKNGTSYFLEKMKPLFEADDFTVANCEVVFTDDDTLPVRQKGHPVMYWFKSATENARIFTDGGVDIVSVANNHTHDYQDAGFEDTVEAVVGAGLEYGNNGKVIVLEKYGKKIALICTTMYWSEAVAPVVETVKEYAEITDYQIVYYHGGTEKVYEPDAWRIRASHELVDAGADLVVGHHAHYLQPVEEYNGATIVYSLGNFCYGSLVTQETKQTVVFQQILTVTDDELVSDETNIIPCFSTSSLKANDYQPYILPEGEDKEAILAFMRGETVTPHVGAALKKTE